MGNYGTYGVGSAWWQIPEGYSLHARFNKYLQNHSIKAGSEVRIKRGEAARFRFYNFVVNANATANTTSSPNLAQVGHPWASFLLGALDNNSSAQYVPMQKSDTEMYGLYVQDDFRIRENLTLNLGLRWEYEGGSLRSRIPPAAGSRSDSADSRAAGGDRSAHPGRRQGDHGANPPGRRATSTTARTTSPTKRTRATPRSRPCSSCRGSALRGASTGRRPSAQATAGSTRRRCSSTRTPRWASSISARSAR